MWKVAITPARQRRGELLDRVIDTSHNPRRRGISLQKFSSPGSSGSPGRWPYAVRSTSGHLLAAEVAPAIRQGRRSLPRGAAELRSRGAAAAPLAPTRSPHGGRHAAPKKPAPCNHNLLWGGGPHVAAVVWPMVTGQTLAHGTGHLVASLMGLPPHTRTLGIRRPHAIARAMGSTAPGHAWGARPPPYSSMGRTAPLRHMGAGRGAAATGTSGPRWHPGAAMAPNWPAPMRLRSAEWGATRPTAKTKTCRSTTAPPAKTCRSTFGL